jgi:hypothetical protein
MQLTVKESYWHDMYKDTIRVHHSERSHLKSGDLIKVSVGGRSTLVAIRGLDDSEKGNILLDLETRRRLQVNVDERHDFSFSKIGLFGKISWAYNATDPMARIATGIAVWLGLLGVLLGLVSVVLGIWPLMHH